MGNRWSRWVAERQASPAVKHAMYHEWGPLLYLGGIFLYLEPKLAPLSIIQCTTFITVLVFHSYLMLVTMPESPTMVGFSQLLNYFSLGLIQMGIFYGALINRSCIARLLEIMYVDFYDYGDTFDLQEIYKWKRNLRRFKIIIYVCIPSYLAVVAGTVMLREYIDMMFGYVPSDEDYIGAIYQKTPIKMWYPFTITNNFERSVVTLIQMFHAGMLALSIGTADVMMLFLGQTVALQMRILSTAALKLDERATNMYAKMSGGLKPPTDPLKRRRDKTLDVCYKQAIKFFKNYNILGRWPTFLAVLNGSILIAMSIAVVILGAGDVPSTFISAGELLVAEVMSMWLLCETGQLVSEWSEKLNEAMYKTDWIDISTANKRLIMIFKEKSKRPLVLMAGGLTPINRDTFGTIMNSAYTYVNLLRASERKSAS